MEPDKKEETEVAVMGPDKKEETEVARVTSGKAKSPGRVAWGRKLSALAKAHKNEKAAAGQPCPVACEDTCSQKTSLYTWIAVGTLVIGAAALYYQRMASLANLRPAPPEIISPDVPPVSKPRTTDIISMQ